MEQEEYEQRMKVLVDEIDKITLNTKQLNIGEIDLTRLEKNERKIQWAREEIAELNCYLEVEDFITNGAGKTEEYDY